MNANTDFQKGHLFERETHNTVCLQSKKQYGGVYNLQSWLKGISTTNNRFSETLYYNESFKGGIPCYNGNISAINWKVQNDTQRGRTFHLDDNFSHSNWGNNGLSPRFISAD